MKVLIADEDPIKRREIRRILREMDSEGFLSDEDLHIDEESPSRGSMMLILSAHPRSWNYDMVIAADTFKKAAGITLTRILTEKEIAPSAPFFIYGAGFDEVKMASPLLPLNVVHLDYPFTSGKIKEQLTDMCHRMVQREERHRAQVIQTAMEKISRSEKVRNIPSILEGVYLKSAARVMRFRKYAPWYYLPDQALGKIFLGMNQPEKAIPHLKDATAKHFRCRECHRLLAMAYRRAGKSFEELEELKEMLGNAPDDPRLLFKMGDALLREGDYENAREYFEKALVNYDPGEEHQTRASLHVGLGRSFLLEGEGTGKEDCYKRAEDEFNRAVKIYPLLMAAYNNLIIVYKRLGMMDEAREVISKAMEITPETAEDWLAMFEIYLQEGEKEKARYSLEKALKFDPENQIILCTAAELYVRQAMYEEALWLFERAVEVNPSDTRLYNWLGICCRQLNRFALSVEYYTRALKIDPEDPHLFFNLGTAYRAMGETDNAKNAYRNALKINPKFEQARKALQKIENAA